MPHTVVTIYMYAQTLQVHVVLAFKTDSIQWEKYGLKLKVVLKWRDNYIGKDSRCQ